jgi:hypothetical protein
MKGENSMSYDCLSLYGFDRRSSSSLRILFLITLVVVAFLNAFAAYGESDAPKNSGTSIRVVSILPVKPLSRAARTAGIEAIIENVSNTSITVAAKLLVPEGVRVDRSDFEGPFVVEAAARVKAGWDVVAESAGARELTLQILSGDVQIATTKLSMDFLAPIEQRKEAYIPEPNPLETSVIVGAHNCPLWESDKFGMWSQLLKHPERTPALGFYGQENPEVADWETKWAVEHGVSFFIYCWYRSSQGEPVKTRFGSAIHDALFNSKFADKMKFTIMWENQCKGVAGVSDEKDLMENLLPFWIENYFKNPGYLKIDNKPLLFIYRPEYLVDDLGSVENVVKAFDKMRQACKGAGFDGLYLLGEYRGLDIEKLKELKSLGLDYTFAYCWNIPKNPTPSEAIDAQMNYIKKTREMGVIPEVVTVSQAWSGWNDEGTIWKIPPNDFRDLLKQAKDYIATFPASELGSKLLILDNWNEWGEGHYLAPYREYGFGYLDAIRDVFGINPGPHEDLIPEDIGLGPYDAAYREHARKEEESKKNLSKRVLKTDPPEKGLIAWWTFDDGGDDSIYLDYSGQRTGGLGHNAKQAPGIDGKALVCDGGSVVVPNDARLYPESGVSVECWVKTDSPEQANNWFLNSVMGGAEGAGYRMGVLEGRPCFEIPKTPWSHHLKANAPLSAGRWTHVAGTFDGATMRIYIDGVEQGSMERKGSVNQTSAELVLGNYAQDHNAFFSGVLDEVKIFDKALTSEEVQAHYAALADRAKN